MVANSIGNVDVSLEVFCAKPFRGKMENVCDNVGNVYGKMCMDTAIQVWRSLAKTLFAAICKICMEAYMGKYVMECVWENMHGHGNVRLKVFSANSFRGNMENMYDNVDGEIKEK